jgi:PAS domain S-box-containing protein
MVLEAKASQEDSPATRPRAVLVIDPNEEHQALSSMALSRRGFKVTVAGSGREGMRFALTQAFDAIVLDVKIRDLPAIDVVKSLVERLPDVPKIFVVASGQEDMALKALQAGAAGFLVKTPRYNELLPSEVENHIGRALAREEVRVQRKALGEVEDRFAKAFRASPLALAITSVAEGRLIDVNDGLLRMLEFSRDEVIGRTVAELELWGHPEDRAAFVQALKVRGAVRDAEFWFRKKSGGLLLGSVSAELIELEGETCFLSIMRDVTLDRRAETVRAAIYRISEATSTVQNLQELFPIIHVIVGELMPAKNLYISLYDPKGDSLSFPYYVDEADLPPPPAKLGRGLTEYVLRTCEPLLASPEVFDDLVKRGEVETVGAPSVDWLGVPLIVKGRSIGVMAVQTYTEGLRYTVEDKDILTFVSGQVAMAIERVQAEESLRRAEGRFRTMFQGAPVGIALTDLTGRIVETNPSFQSMMGFSGEELRDKAIDDLTHEADVPRNRRLLHELVDGARTGYQLETRYRRKDGTMFWARHTASLLKDESGKPTYVIDMVEDVTQQKESEEKARATDRRYRALIDNISDVIILSTSEGSIIYASPSTSKVLGYSPDEFVGMNAFRLTHPDDVERMSNLLDRLVQNPGSSMMAEWRIRRKDGSFRWVEGVGTNLLDDPTVGGIVSAFRDVTDRTLALEQVRFQASLLEQVRNAVIATDVDFNLVYWNEYAETMYGWRATEVLGKNAFDLLMQSNRDALIAALDRSLRAVSHWESEVTATRRDGTTFPAFLTVTALRNSLNEPAGFVAVSADITDRVKAEAEIKARAREQAAVAELGQKALAGESLPRLLQDAVSLVARTLEVELCKVLELAPEGDVLRLRAGVGWKDGYVGRATVGVGMESQAGYTLASKEPVIVEDLPTETRFHGPPLLYEHGVVSGMSVTIPGSEGPFGVLGAHSTKRRAFSLDDVHFMQAVANVIAAAIERARTEKALAESERLASMGQLAAYVAHEINTPLTNISLLAAGIARRTDDSEIRDKLDRIHVQRRRAAAIITDILSLPKQRSLERAPCDLRKVVAAAVDQLEPSRRPSVSLDVDVGERPVVADIDAIQIQHVLMNLLRNALEATSSGSITVRLKDQGDRVLLVVADTGTGMPPEILDQLFKPLFTTKQRGEGSGLGLSFSQSVVNAHGGTIEVASEVGKGSTFTVALPR